MFDLSSGLSFVHARKWKQDTCPHVPTVFCGNKTDMTSRAVRIPRRSSETYCELSVKKNSNISKPFEKLCRIITGDSSLKFVVSPAALPSQRIMKQKWIDDSKRFLLEASQIALPDDDDDDEDVEMM